VLNPRYQGVGYATEAVDALIGWLFARGARSVFANCYLRNTASIALSERLGFAEERRYTASQDDSGKNLASCRLRRDLRCD
jgi:[ribosomal protein S5]-alanine N-acetyltransferase